MVDREEELFGGEELEVVMTPPEKKNFLPLAFAEPGAEIPPEVVDCFLEGLSDDVPTALRVTEQDGQPLVRRRPVLNKAQMEDLLMVALSDPLSIDPEKLKDSPMIQRIFFALNLKASTGDLDAIKEVLNRVMGKAKQDSRNLNVTTGLEEYNNYLKSLEDGGEQTPTNP